MAFTIFPGDAHFDGDTYEPVLDKVRLTGQLLAVYTIMKDGDWYTLKNLRLMIGKGTEAAVSARIRDLRKRKFGGFTVDRKRTDSGLFFYRLIVDRRKRMARKDREKRKGRKERGSKRKNRGRRKSGFKYERRSAKKWQERAEQSGYSRRSMFVDEVKLFRPKDGDNLVRILPPTFDEAEHYGFEVFVHYGIGPDNDAFLDLNKMQSSADPIVEERARALKDNDKDYADKLTSRKRVMVYIIDRDDEAAGLQLWSCPWTLDADITTLAVDKRTGEVLDIDDPEDGYDVEFTKKGTGRNTQYVGVAIARKPSPLENDAALEEAVERPLPDCLKYYEYEEIQKIFDAGGAAYDDEDDDDEDEDDDEEEKPSRSKKKDKGRRKKYDDDDDEEEEADAVTWDDVMAMDFEELSDLIEDEELEVEADGVDEDDEEETDELRKEVVHELGLKKPKKRKASSKERKKLRKRGRD